MKFLESFGESHDWIEGGTVLIIGKPSTKDGYKRLYAISLKKIYDYERKLKSGARGVPSKTAILSNDIRILKYKNGNIVTKKIDYNPKIMREILGLSSFSVSLNKNKTPFWEESIKLTIEQFIKQYNDELINYTGGIVYPIED